ncbi:MAG: DUF4019 domain-containing protein [Burkholderiaceae bacterium]
MKTVGAIACVLFAAAAGVQAQTQPSPPPSQSSGSVSLPGTDSSSAFKELAAQAAAEKWLALIDSGEYSKTWDQTAQFFRDRVTREQWTSSLPTTRAPFGAMKSRKVDAAAYKTSLPGVPDGQYVTVRFRTTFDKKEGAEELVTLSYEDGAWKPTGYYIK